MKKTYLDELDRSLYDLKMKFMHRLYVLTSIVLIGFVIYLSVQKVIPVLILCGSALALVAVTGFLSARGKLSLVVSANAFNFLLLVLIVATFFTSGGLQAPSLFWLPVLCLSTMILLGMKYMYIISGIAVFIVALFFLAQSSGTEFHSQYSQSMLYQVHFVHYILLTIYVISLGVLQTRLQGRVNEYKESLHLKLHHENRLASLGELSAGIGHELNNPLAIAMGNLSVLQHISEENSDSRWSEATEKMNDALVRMKNIIITVSRLSRAKDTSRDKFEVNRTVGETIGLFEQMFKKAGIVIDFQKSAESIYVSGNVQQFIQVLMNLLSNSRDSLKEVSRESKHVSIKVSRSEKRVVVEVKDNGPGIKPENLSRVFDSFFTTKEVGQGTGLGLSLSKRFIADMGGDLTCRSVENEWTSFTIEMPEVIGESL